MALWKKQLAQGLKTPAELLAYLSLDSSLLSGAQAGHRLFPIRVPKGFADRMKKGDASDPLLKQVLPGLAEEEAVDGFSVDPLHEQKNNPLPGLLHKYHGRVLLTLAGACAINCRYCFRRHFPYQDNNPGKAGWQKNLSYIAQDDSIKEVIFSGGDPLLVGDDTLGWWLQQLEAIPHVKRVRIHSRLPTVLPVRITEDFLSMMQKTALNVVLVIHSNHAQELDSEVEQVLSACRDHGITLLNQAVLLKGVNDSVSTLVDLSERLFACGVLPYYLHQLDRVQGVAHFEIPKAQARKLYRDLQANLPGFLVPKWACEQPGEAHKTLLG